MKLALMLVCGLLAAPVAWAQAVVQESPGAAAQPAPGAPMEASPAAPAEPAAVVVKAADVGKAVDCATLSQQFGDTLTALTAPTAKTPLDENVKATSSEQASAGRQACMAYDYDSGMESLRQAITTLGKKPIV